MNKCASYGPKCDLTLGEFRDITRNYPDSFGLFVRIDAKYYDMENIVVDVKRETGESAVSLYTKTYYPGRDPEDMIDELEDEVDELKECLKSIERVLVDNLRVEMSSKELWDKIRDYL